MSHRSSRVVCIATRVVMTLLQVALVAGCFVLNHFANTRMGAARHISWRSVQMERAMDMQLVLLLLGLAVIAMCIVITFVLVKRKDRIAHRSATCIALWAFPCVFTVFVIMFSCDTVRAYYYLSFMLFAVSVLQMVKTLIAIKEGSSD